MAQLAALVTPGPFKARQGDPERMLGEFQKYIKSVKSMLVVTGQKDAEAEVKKEILKAIGGPDMVSLFEHEGNVADEDTFDQAVAKIEAGIREQTNKAMAKYKLFLGLPQEGEAFSTWWKKIQ